MQRRNNFTVFTRLHLLLLAAASSSYLGKNKHCRNWITFATFSLSYWCRFQVRVLAAPVTVVFILAFWVTRLNSFILSIYTESFFWCLIETVPPIHSPERSCCVGTSPGTFVSNKEKNWSSFAACLDLYLVLRVAAFLNVSLLDILFCFICCCTITTAYEAIQGT